MAPPNALRILAESQKTGEAFLARSRPKPVRAWRWQPQFNDGALVVEDGSLRDDANHCWVHPSGVCTPDNGNPSYVTTAAGVDRPKNGDVIVVRADGTRFVMSPGAFVAEYEPA